MTTQPPAEYRISIKAFIHEGGRVLLVQEDSNEWGLPGGGLDHGESVGEGLHRELREELSAEVACMSDAPITLGPGYIPEDKRWKFWLTYEVKLATEPKPGSDHMKIGWFTPAEIANIRIDEVEADNLSAVLKRLS